MNDPFIIFYIGLVMLINVKEELLELREEPKEKVVAFLTGLPDNLQTEDVADLFFLVEQHFIPNTPRSIQEYKELLFTKTGLPDDDEEEEEDDDLGENGPQNGLQSNKSNQLHSISTSTPNNALDDLSQMLCLPVQVPYLISCCSPASVSPTRYFIVDCRPAEQYNNGHLNTAFHLDCSLMLQEPSSFNTAVQALLVSQAQAIDVGSAAGGEHLCFLGSGREEEDRYLHMVIAFFLQKKQKYVSMVAGGYERLHRHLADKSLLQVSMVDHNRRYCLPCVKHDSIRCISSAAHSNAAGRNVSSKDTNASSGPSLMSHSASTSSGFFGIPNSLSQTFSTLNKNLQIGLSKDDRKTSVNRPNEDVALNASGEGESLFEKMATTFKSKSAVVKEKFADMIAQNATTNTAHKHVSSDKLGKRYNPKHFSLVEDGSNALDFT